MSGLSDRRAHLAAWALCCLLATAAAHGQSASGKPRPEVGPTWSSLTVMQRRQLEPLHAEWAGIDALRKQKWLDLAARMPSMSPAEQDRVRVRMAEWARMSPAERGRARLQFLEARQIAPGDRQERWESYQSLPADQRQALARKAQPTSPKTAATAQGAVAPSTTMAPNAKRNVVTFAPSSAPARPVAPTVVQSRTGATTSLITKKAAPPVHHQAGLPKIAATKNFVDQSTLLPKRGPQGAAAAPSTPAVPPPALP